MADLILVGTVHGDSLGYPRAWKLLEKVRPNLITVEISQFSLKFRKKQGQTWRRRWQRARNQLPEGASHHLALRRIEALLTWPFEVQAAHDFAQQHGLEWRAIDTGQVSRSHLRRFSRELLTPDNLRNLLLTEDGDWGQYIAAQYQQARLALAQPDRFISRFHPSWTSPEMIVREKIMARRLRKLTKAAGQVVHLGGWTHLLTGGGLPTLAQHLEDLQPQRLLLDQF
ncbi:MAG: hypothetical protein JRI57_07950 [Deltaproteobacteria bacterium]|nr:hypothetical protein [Deltaproteobacteria bacterium]MBW1952646.1 hypothetical protein [Deltaproteobacteria bacterium]MBW1986226.1 hypothetical protein [Deltaproteobacteria bacterium]MBW2134123.1 hypothetical protein [Deltaproteobacteria bacterium]